MGDTSEEKCAIFIDGGYFNKVLERTGIPNVDYLKFSNKICNFLGLTRLRTYYYHCLPFFREGNEEDKKRLENMKKFLHRLNRLPRFDVKYGEIQMIKGEFKQKMIDVLISLDIVNMCFENQIQHVILIAGDKDFIPAIDKAKSYGVIIHLFCHEKAVNQDLLDKVDEIHYISKEFFVDCLIEGN